MVHLMVAGAAFITFYWFRARAKLFRGLFVNVLLVITVGSFLYASRSMLRTWVCVNYIIVFVQDKNHVPAKDSRTPSERYHVVHQYSGPDDHTNPIKVLWACSH
jgi:hypothetical protein